MCHWFQGWTVFDARILCAATGLPVYLAALVACLIGLLSLFWMVRGGATLWGRLGGAATMLAALLFSLAAGLPVLQPLADAPAGGRLIVLVDASESVRRSGEADLAVARQTVASQSADLAQDLPDGADWRGAVLSFGGSASVVAPDVALGDLGPSILGADLGALAQQSNLQAAIDAALHRIARGPGAGQIMLLSDGLQTQGQVESAVTAAQQAGVAIHTFGVGSNSPIEGLLSIDIGPDQAVGREAVLRATVQGAGRLVWGINGVDEADQPQVSAADPTGVRIPVTFGERGLNFMTLSYETSNGATRPELAYTLVRGPARVLVFGAAPWVDGADPVMFLIDRADPADAVDLAGYDAIVIDAFEPAQFAADMPQRLLEAAASGAGLFIVNGPVRGSVEDMQRLSDWEETVIGPVLPVNSDPAQYIADPPKRDILIIIDTSGSMGSGNYMDLARAATNKVLDSLRPQDSITILPFSSDALRAFTARSASPDNLANARAFISRLNVAGGTSMDRALAAAQGLRGNNCALFIIGDGGYEEAQVRVSPICPTTAIGVADDYLPGIDTSWGQSIKIASIGQLGAITYEAFAPEPRTTFWAEGPFRAIPVEDASVFAFIQTVSGAALSYPRPESTDLAVMSAPPRAPVLAFRQDPKVLTLRTGVFLGVVPSGLPAGPTGWASEVLKQLVGWDDTGLFDIKFQLIGDEAEVRITALGDEPIPTRLGASILLPDGSSAGFALRPLNRFGVFEGKARVNLQSEASRGVLNLEFGDGKMQSIPLRLPGRQAGQVAHAATREAFGFGIDHSLLDDMRLATGGLDLTLSRPTILRDAPLARPWPLWPFLAGLAIFLFAGSLMFGGVRR